MQWSVRLFNVGETTVRLHLSFFLLLIWVAWLTWSRGGPLAALDGILFIVLVFVCVVLHEFGHVIAARRYGISTPDITILPIGGLASLEKMPDKPGQELIVAFAGPLVNVVIAAILFAILGARFDLSEVAQVQEAGMTLSGRLAAVNVLLVAFNILPAFPLDGGRAFRALLSYRMPRAKATRYAAWTGQAFAIAFAVIGLMYNPFLVLIALFMFFAGEAESSYETERAAATGRSASDAMISRFESLSPESTADDAAKLLLVTTQQEFPVLDGRGALMGVVTRQGLIDAMQGSGPTTPVTDFMEREVEQVREDAALDEVLHNITRGRAQCVAVMAADGRFLGYVNRENASELFALDQARESRGGGGGRGGAGETAPKAEAGA
jgi:stage IV sporulation protein FB